MQTDEEPYCRATAYQHAAKLLAQRSFVDYLISTGLDVKHPVDDNLTDEQGAEFIAFVARTIGFDIGDSVGGEQRVRQLRDAYDAADSPSSPA